MPSSLFTSETISIFVPALYTCSSGIINAFVNNFLTANQVYLDRQRNISDKEIIQNSFLWYDYR